MNDSPATRPSLLVRIREPRDSEAWSQFVDIYAPLIYGFALKNGLQDADAADLTQDVLRAVARAARELDYDPRRGSFRGWLFTVARNKLRNFLASQGRRCRGTGDTDTQKLLEQQPAPEEDEQQLWDEEYDRRLFDCAAAQIQGEVQESTWQAFWQTAVKEQSPKEVAERLAMTVANVYRAKSRVLSRMKERIRELQGEDERSSASK